jgi:hypothetical protein
MEQIESETGNFRTCNVRRGRTPTDLIGLYWVFPLPRILGVNWVQGA